MANNWLVSRRSASRTCNFGSVAFCLCGAERLVLVVQFCLEFHFLGNKGKREEHKSHVKHTHSCSQSAQSIELKSRVMWQTCKATAASSPPAHTPTATNGSARGAPQCIGADGSQYVILDWLRHTGDEPWEGCGRSPSVHFAPLLCSNTSARPQPETLVAWPEMNAYLVGEIKCRPRASQSNDSALAARCSLARN